jgi:DHA1 family bicyclomycin/chloramphenicol resistance-like MFS transporter
VTARVTTLPTRPPLAILVAVSALQPFSLNVLAPATPGLARALETDYATVQLTLILYLIAVAATQLVVGPISDRYGRRPCILAGIVLFAAGSLLGAAAGSMGTLLLARIVQAIGGGTCFALARAVVRDSATKDRATSLLGYLTMAMVVSPMVAPLVGGLLDRHFGWRAIFLVMLVLSALVAGAAYLHLRETAIIRLRGPFALILKGYPDLLRSRTFIGYTLAVSSTSAAFFGFVAGAPYVVVEVMQQPPDVYGFYFLGNAGSYMLGNFISGRFGERIGGERLTVIGLYLSLASMGLEIVCLFALPWTPATLFLPLMLNGVGNGLTIPGGMASALSVRPDLAGTASGLVGATQLGLGAVSAALIGTLVLVSPTALVWGMLTSVLLGWLALVLLVGARPGT